MNIVNVYSVIARIEGKYRMEFYRSHNLLIPDALIAASARLNNASLVTGNIRHFPMEDLVKIKL